VDDHVSVADSPAAMLAGEAERDTVGASVVTVTSTLVTAVPPMPMQARI
jgi:hypothetical protein